VCVTWENPALVGGHVPEHLVVAVICESAERSGGYSYLVQSVYWVDFITSRNEVAKVWAQSQDDADLAARRTVELAEILHWEHLREGRLPHRTLPETTVNFQNKQLSKCLWWPSLLDGSGKPFPGYAFQRWSCTNICFLKQHEDPHNVDCVKWGLNCSITLSSQTLQAPIQINLQGYTVRRVQPYTSPSQKLPPRSESLTAGFGMSLKISKRSIVQPELSRQQESRYQYSRVLTCPTNKTDVGVLQLTA